jgi:hypothetical protein
VVPSTGASCSTNAKGFAPPSDADQTAEIIAAALPNAPIHGPRSNVPLPADHCDIAKSASLDFVAATSIYLVERSELRIALLTWARAKAMRVSISEICVEKGWKPATFESRRRVACQTFADGLNSAAIPIRRLAGRTGPLGPTNFFCAPQRK